MLLFWKHWLKTIQKYPKYRVYCPSDAQLWHDVEMLYSILQSVFNVSHAQRLFREDNRPYGFRDGIAMYVKIIKTIGLNTQTRIWHLEGDLQRVFDPSIPNGLKLYIHQYRTAFADLEYLGKSICQRTKLDTLLKNMITAENPESILLISSEAQ
jgi:hypothetical protein